MGTKEEGFFRKVSGQTKLPGNWSDFPRDLPIRMDSTFA